MQPTEITENILQTQCQAIKSSIEARQNPVLIVNQFEKLTADFGQFLSILDVNTLTSASQISRAYLEMINFYLQISNLGKYIENIEHVLLLLEQIHDRFYKNLFSNSTPDALETCLRAFIADQALSYKYKARALVKFNEHWAGLSSHRVMQITYQELAEQYVRDLMVLLTTKLDDNLPVKLNILGLWYLHNQIFFNKLPENWTYPLTAQNRQRLKIFFNTHLEQIKPLHDKNKAIAELLTYILIENFQRTPDIRTMKDITVYFNSWFRAVTSVKNEDRPAALYIIEKLSALIDIFNRYDAARALKKNCEELLADFIFVLFNTEDNPKKKHEYLEQLMALGEEKNNHALALLSTIQRTAIHNTAIKYLIPSLTHFLTRVSEVKDTARLLQCYPHYGATQEGIPLAMQTRKKAK